MISLVRLAQRSAQFRAVDTDPSHESDQVSKGDAGPGVARPADGASGEDAGTRNRPFGETAAGTFPSGSSFPTREARGSVWR